MKQHFFNKTLELFKSYKIKNKKMLLAVSGGLDSVVLLDLLKELSSPCKLQLCSIYIHHGQSLNKEIENYRDKAKNFICSLSQSYGVEFLSPTASKKMLKSEKDFRDFRYYHFEKMIKEKKTDSIVLAHNSDDLLESRLLQLLRGCGPEGLISMQAWKAPYLRPLLGFTKKEIKNYATQNKLSWMEDPSNKDNQYLRNWIRNKWLMDLERKRTGSIKSLARSLEALTPTQNKDFCFSAIYPQGIQRQLLIEMSEKNQKRVLAFYMRKLGLSNYGQSHIEEILKQIKRKEKKFSIKILKKTWTFTDKWISAK